jgi:hypothetical protein
VCRGNTELAPGKQIAGSARRRTAVIRRNGDELSVMVNNQQVSQTKVPADSRYGLGLSVRGGRVTVADLRLRESLGEPIFNGVDLTGWWTPGKIDAWQAIDGELVLAGRGGNYLRSEKLYGNFTLSFEYKIKKGGNSGLGIRTARDGWPSSDGMELQILDRPNVDKGGMMSIYRNVATLAVAHKSEEWNQVVIKAEGRMISAWINGQLVQQVNTHWEPELKHRHLAGWIGFQDHGAKIQVRHLRITEAPEGLGPKAWYEPRPESAQQFVFGRLMNPERLSRDDGSWGAIVTGTAEDEQERVLAELAGPGALVWIASDDWSGELVMRFDGEEEPRIVCKAADLHGQVPRPPAAQGKTPVITCLPFRESLRITVCDSAPATYRFGWVRLPKTVDVETYDKQSAAIPESLAAALDYRAHHHRHGTVRQQDPYLRVASDRMALAPGDEIEMVGAEGAGLVQWLQLHAPKNQLQRDDLWIAIGVDGEAAPAVEAPVRYFFSGVAVAGRFGNYLFTERDGPISRLAIPFGDGIRMSLSNRGGESIDGVGLTASIQQATNENETRDFAGRLRLRGVFQGAAEQPAGGVWFRQKARGRCVGLVWDVSPLEPSELPAEQADGDKPEEDASDGGNEEAEGTDADGATGDKKEGDGAEQGGADADSPEPDKADDRHAAELIIRSLDIDGRPAIGWQPADANILLGDAANKNEFRGVLSGRQGGLAWTYFQLAPIDFEREIAALLSEQSTPRSRLVLFYTK